MGTTTTACNNAVVVTDPGSTWIIDGALNIGGDAAGPLGSGNSLMILNGGRVSATSATVGEGYGSGILIGQNGLLVITNETGTAQLDLHGALSMNGGTALVDCVSVRSYNGFTTNVSISGTGTIVGSLLVETGSALYVESGSQIAITGAVTNRSVIRVAEAGSLDFFGPVVNAGYIENFSGNVHFHSTIENIGGGAVLDSNSIARLRGLTVAGSNTLLRFSTTTNAPYTVASCSNLVQDAWVEEPGSLLGNGGVLTVTNSGAATAPQQFRRVILNAPDYVP